MPQLEPAPQAASAGLDQALRTALKMARGVCHASTHHARVIEILRAMGRRDEAALEIAAAQRMPSGRAEDYEALGFVAFALGEHEAARDFYALVSVAAPSDAMAWYNLATSERNLGNLAAAEQACDRALALDRRLVQAALLRSHLRTQSPGSNHVDALCRALESAGGEPAARMFLNYAIGKELDDLGEYDEAFRHFSAGALIRRASLRYDVGDDLRKLGHIRETFGGDRLSAAPAMDPEIEYGFVMGLPRSGTTLLERVLTGNPHVRSNGETDNLMAALMSGAAVTGADIFERVARADPRRVAADYDLRAGRPAAGGLVVEKLPLNYLYAGGIQLTLPKARIVLLTRSPADNCLGMFTTLFGTGYPFSYALSDLARYHLAYRALTDHWKQHLGDRLLEVSHEALIEKPIQVGRLVAAHLGIEWHDAMVKIEDNRTASATASAAQVRKPIYKSAGRWRNYEGQLAPLTDFLRARGVDPDRGA